MYSTIFLDIIFQYVFYISDKESKLVFETYSILFFKWNAIISLEGFVLLRFFSLNLMISLYNNLIIYYIHSYLIHWNWFQMPEIKQFFLYVSEGRILELHSPDGVHECWLRASDNTEANVWFNALHSALASLTLKALRLASALPDPPQLQHIGWLARRHCVQVDRILLRVVRKFTESEGVALTSPVPSGTSTTFLLCMVMLQNSLAIKILTWHPLEHAR